MKRVFTLCSAALLVICTATTVTWVRSNYVLDHIWYDTSPSAPPQQRWVVVCAGGRVSITWNSFFDPALEAYQGTPLKLVENRGWNNRFGEVTDGSYASWSLVPSRKDNEEIVAFGVEGSWEHDPANRAIYRSVQIPFFLLVGAFGICSLATARYATA